MSNFPKTVLFTSAVKNLRDRLVEGGVLTKLEMMDLIASHEQLRAIALVRSERLRASESERDRLQRIVEGRR